MKTNKKLLSYLFIIIGFFLVQNTVAQIEDLQLKKLLDQKQYNQAIGQTLLAFQECDTCTDATKHLQFTFMTIFKDEDVEIQDFLDKFLTPPIIKEILPLQNHLLSDYDVTSKWSQILYKFKAYTQQQNDLALEARVNLCLGNFCYYSHQTDSVGYFYNLAIGQAKKALASTPSQLIPFYQKYINFHIGHTQDFETALIYAFELLQILKNNPNYKISKVALQITYAQIADIYFTKGDIDRAIDYAQQTLLLSATLSTVKKINSLQLLYKCHVQAGNLKEASRLLQEVSKLMELIQVQDTNSSLQGFILKIYIDHNLNIMQDQSSSPKEASEAFDLLLNASRNIESVIMLADFSLSQNDSILSFEILESLEITLEKLNATNLPRVAKAFLVFGNFQLKHRTPKQALQKYQKAIATLMAGAELEEGQDIIAATNDHKTLLKVLIQKDKAYQQLTIQDLDLQLERYQNLKLAIEVIDQLRQDYSTKGAKMLLLNNVPQIYNEAIDLLHNLYTQDQNSAWLEEAFALSEKSKAMLLMDALKEDKAHHFGNVPDSLRKQEQSLQKDISFYKAELFKAKQIADSTKAKRSQQYIFEKRAQLDQLKKHLEKNYPKYYQLKHNEQIASIATLQKRLNSTKQAVVEYMVSENFVHIFAITAQNASWHKFSKQQLTEPIDKLYQTLINPSLVQKKPEAAYTQFTKNAHQLYQLLIAPLQGKLEEAQIEELIIIPDGTIAYIPFEVLLSAPVSESIDYKYLAYLLQTYQTSYSYSASLWLECVQKATQGIYNSKILGLAPNYDKTLNYSHRSSSIQVIRKGLEELKGTQKELSFLQDNFEGSFYKNVQANEAIFKKNASQYGLIHLAMHGIINVKQPNYSALAFAENSDTLNDNLLYAYELPSLMLNAQLVVLSACQTGYGKYQNGEGVMSLGRGFMYAGTPSLVMTLWPINDQASANIMEYFYLNLKDGLPKNKALQQAKLTYIENSQGIAAHPAFWAPFILHGDTSALTFESNTQWYYWLIGLAILLLLFTFIRSKSKN
ncbi:MAG: CHAT domain-containing protein [Aureispira sp.]|nr:CHAT domain-containing protein [Aureispira sp.]